MNSMLSTPINLLENAKNSKLHYENVNMFTLCLVTNVELLSGLGKSDHVSLDIWLRVSLSKPMNVSRNVIIKQAWSKISFGNLLHYSLKNID